MTFAPTPRQLELLRFIRGYQLQHGWSPSYAEMRDGLGLASTSKSSIARIVDSCEERGLLRRLPKRARTIQLLVHPPIPQAPDGAPLFAVAGVPS